MTPEAATQSGSAASEQAAGTPQTSVQQQRDPSSVQGGSAPAVPATPESQGTAGATPQGQPGSAGTPAAPAVPDRYELRLPDQSPLDQTDIDALTTMAKTRGWTNEDAQAALTDMHTSLVAQRRTFRTELEADREVGGAQLEGTQLQARRVLDRFLPASDPDGARLRTAINKSGYGDWLPLAKLLARIGKAMGEDSPLAGGQQTVGAPQKRSHADILFGDAPGSGRSG